MGSFKVLGGVVLSIAAVVGLSVALDLGSLFYQKETAEFRGKSKAEVQIESASSRIQRYEEFFNLCQSIQAKEFAIDNAKSTMDKENPLYNATIIGNMNQRNALISEYNSKSSQNYTSARFKASNLPYRIPNGTYTGTNKTVCEYGQ